MLKFTFLILPIILSSVCNVYGEDDSEFIIPPFLFGASESTIEEMRELLQRYIDKPDSQMEAAIEEWTRAKGGAIKEKYDQFKASIKLLHDKTTLLRQAVAQNLSAEAKQADMDLANIGKDKTLSAQQKKEKFEAYLTNLPTAVKNELQAIFRAKLKK
ncbi:unnamed protein product [Litomosoides sigmodontis]|uniref:SXP/RAL-2 family protein Ani s 5-like cation-binding domain-containing protein n=1 Tax=Litomosoides sigmodontis TaxID=42156 RepID=A0A3P6U2F5_LITSI|nr:unnamed protein product [Litomosoides sigmodontis]